MGNHTAVRTSTTSSLPSALAVGSQWGRTTWRQPTAPGTQSASSARWASNIRPHTLLVLMQGWESMTEIPTHLLYLHCCDHRADSNHVPDEYVAVEMMQIKQRGHILLCGCLLHFLQSDFCVQQLVRNASMCSCCVLTVRQRHKTIAQNGLSWEEIICLFTISAQDMTSTHQRIQAWSLNPVMTYK